MNSAVSGHRPELRVGLLLFVAALLVSPSALAAGFEAGENTTKSIARGGTGAALKRDPSALYFNPALLASVPGTQVLLNSNFLKLNLEFQRDPLGSTTFDQITNTDGFKPGPFLSASYSILPDEFAIGLSINGPSSYGQRCYGERVDGTCEADELHAGRHMTIGATIIELYATLGASYKLDTPVGDFGFGSALMLGYQNANFDIVAHGDPVFADIATSNPEQSEDPEAEARIEARRLTNWQPSGVFGLSYHLEGLTVGVSYRLPFNWKSSGTIDFEVPPRYEGQDVALTDDRVTLEANQAGMFRAGVGYQHRSPTDDSPVFDVEFDFMWENWSRLQEFIVRPEGSVTVGGGEFKINNIYQPKGYQDTFSYRLGGGYHATEWLKIHGGGLYETAAQPEEYTNLDFVSWTRYGAGAGVTLRPIDWLDVDLAYMHIFSPDRRVDDGQVYNPIIFSDCTGPDYAGEGCEDVDGPQGTPPGNPQNNGEWSSSFDFVSIGVTMHWD